MLFCLFGCKTPENEEKSASEIYSEALGLTSALSYQKFSLSRSVVCGDARYNDPYSIFCKLIRNGEATSFYSERAIKVETSAGEVSSLLLHHYKDGVMYQTLETGKMKHALALGDFEKQYLGLQSILLSLPSGAEFVKKGENESGGSDFSVALDSSLLDAAELEKLYTVFDVYSSHSLEGDYTIGGAVKVDFSTDFDGYFVKYSITFNVSGTENNESKSLEMTLSLDVFNPGSHFTMNTLANTSEYTEGTLNIK